MRVAENWKDYEIIDTSDGNKLERWGSVILSRPDPQVLWSTKKENLLWESAHGVYHRSKKGGGSWEFLKQVPESWEITYQGLTFLVRPTGFKHTGLFPEQAVNWDFFMDVIAKANRPIKVLNLFAYTGGATLACAKAGAQVVHVDASKGMVNWARDNARLSHLEKEPIRWIVDDCEKFIDRELRRGNQYDAIIMDPPSYGRGPGGEIWKLEDSIHPLVQKAAKLLSNDPLFFVLNSYTTGLSGSVMAYLLGVTLPDGRVSADEIGLQVSDKNLVLPQGNTAIWQPE